MPPWLTPFQGWVREDWDVRAKIIERKTELDQHKEKQRELNKELENKEKKSKLAPKASGDGASEALAAGDAPLPR